VCRNFQIQVVLFDYGGVLAEEGFQEGIEAIAEKNDVDPMEMRKMAYEVSYGTGFITGEVREDVFWAALRKQTGILGKDRELREEILSRFILRPWMIEIVSELRNRGVATGILSDQTHWLDEIEERDHLFPRFNYVFNSFHTGLSKRDPALFDVVVKRLNTRAENILFIDDHRPHILRAEAKGLKTIHYQGKESFLQEFRTLFP